MKVLKKIGAWLILAVCTFMLMVYLVLGYQLLAGDDVFPNSNSDVISQFGVAFCFISALCIFGIFRSIQFIRAKPEQPKVKVLFTRSFEIHVSGEVDFHSYRRFMLKSMFAHPFRIILFCFLAVSIFTSVLTTKDITWQSVAVVMVGIVVPVFVLFRIVHFIKQKYESSFLKHGDLKYTLTNDAFEANGQHLQSKLSWDFHQKILETKDFILLFQNESIATFLPKSKFQPADLELFLEFLQSLPIPYKKS